MKKKIVIALVIVAVLLLSVFFVHLGTNEKEPETTIAEGQPVTVNIEPDTTEKQKEVSYNKKITVTLPADFIDAEYADDLDAFAEANGYDSVKLTDDGKVKVKMRAATYGLIMADRGMETMKLIAYALDSGNYPYFIDLLKYNDDFSSIIISVNKEEYEAAEDRETLLSQLALACLYYQEYSVDSEGVCEVTVCEDGTNILIETKEFTLEMLENAQ